MILASAARDAHIFIGWAVIISNALVGVWALGANYVPPLRQKQLWWATAVAQILVFVQATVGVVIQTQEDLEPPDFHLLYGFTMIVVVTMLYGYRMQIPQHRYLLYGGGGLFLMGMGIRAMII
ncbi:MAG: hypothetical protein ACR2PK_17650 [Acidimicrobiales bacterium]